MWHGRMSETAKDGLVQEQMQQTGLEDNGTEINNIAIKNMVQQTREIDNYLSTKAKYFSKFRNQHGHVHKYCEICSEVPRQSGRMKIIKHFHNSSFLHRIQSLTDYQGKYPCIECRSLHYIKMGDRMPVVLSSSHLHNWIGNPETNNFTGTKMHVDWSSIPGGTVNLSRNAFCALYGNSEVPVDVLIAQAGNDVANGLSAEKIMRDFMRLKATVLSVCPRAPSGPSTFAIATPLHPPMYTHYRNDEHNMKTDYTEVFIELTERIMEHNKDAPNLGNVPQFHRWGVDLQKRAKGATHMGALTKKHRYLEWRESNRDNQIHLNDTRRLAMGRACVTYFENLYKQE